MDETNLIPVACDEVYPAIAVSEPNLQYARMLLPSLAYAKSETSAILTYMYQHWTLSCDFPRIGNTIFRIGKVEMHHMNMLGELITLLGLRPAFCFDRRSCWNGNMIDYTTNIAFALRNNITDEEAAVQFYRNTAQKIKDPKICGILERIAMDEALHVEIFKSMLCDL